MKRQIVVIHGGETFDSYREYLTYLINYEIDFKNVPHTGWKSTLGEKLGEQYEIIAPRMPNSMNAKYLEWKIYFEKHIPYIQDGAVFVGHSLGGIFLAKYLSQNILLRKIAGVFLVAAPFENGVHSLGDFTLPQNLELLTGQAATIFLYHSEDDPIVKFGDLGKYKHLLPTATVRTFKDRGHFDQEEFPELVADIQRVH